jgi:DNA-binding NtrC family response regulator
LNKNLLLVDDDLNHVAVLAVGLVGAGYKVIPEIEAESALAAVRGNARIDIIIVDFEMPGLDASAFMTTQRQFMPNVPVVVLAGRASLESYIKVMEHGAFEYINKPVSVGELKRVLDSALLRSEKNELSRVTR